MAEFVAGTGDAAPMTSEVALEPVPYAALSHLRLGVDAAR